MPQRIRDYWDNRAREHREAPEATTADVYLRELEIETLARTLRRLALPVGTRVLDLGCGDGYSTICVARVCPGLRFEGLDYSGAMIENAAAALAQARDLQSRVSFRTGDATRLADACGEKLYDVVLTDRCLINLETAEQQYDAIRQIRDRLQPGGWYVAIENFIEGHEEMNRARAAVDLPEIPVRWHNLYFREKEFLARARALFESVALEDFSSAYYYVTRVLYARMCRERGEEPDYRHDIHRLGVTLPPFGRFSPIRLAVLRRGTDGRMPADIDFEAHKRANIECLAADEILRRASIQWITDASRHSYSYHFTWLGRPIIQFPQDIVAMQEIIWAVKPDLIVETGIAHGGSLVFYASMLELLGGDGLAVGIDIDIRAHNRAEIGKHPMFKRIRMIEGSSTDPAVVEQVRSLADGRSPVLVVLDSLHTHEHVLRELELYSPLVTKGSYLVVFDTVIEDMPSGSFPDRPWDKGNNPKTAVHEFLSKSDRFEIDRYFQEKLLITVAPDGYLKCVKD